ATQGAKERLLSDRAADSVPVAVLGRGSRVVGGTLTHPLRRDEEQRLLIDGFFPLVGKAVRPARARTIGLQEVGLPYAADAAVTRHLAQFIAAHRLPTALLFNGGVMKGAPLRARILEAVASWSGESPKVLAGTDLDLAVAQGAAYYGLVRRGRGIRIRGGTA